MTNETALDGAKQARELLTSTNQRISVRLAEHSETAALMERLWPKATPSPAPSQAYGPERSTRAD